MITIHDRANLASLDWPTTPDGDYARRYLGPFIIDDPTAYIANAHTHQLALKAGEIILPLSEIQPDPANSYVCSPYSHYILYGQEEFTALKNPALETALRLVFRPLAAYFQRAGLDQALYVNNWLLSTNLYPALPPDLPACIVSALVETFPDRAIIFRSVDSLGNGPLLAGLRGLGGLAIFSRSVWYQDPRGPETLARHNFQMDRRLLRQTPYRILSADELGPEHAARIVQLYNSLYIDKYSHFNPKFTEAFIRLALAEKLLTFKAFERDGRIEAVLGYFIRNGLGTPPIFGYDTARPRALGLYRLLSALFSREAAEQGFTANFSAGVGAFKRARGCRNAIEYNLVFCGHLPAERRRPWKLLQMLMEKAAVPIIRANGF